MANVRVCCLVWLCCECAGPLWKDTVLFRDEEFSNLKKTEIAQERRVISQDLLPTDIIHYDRVLLLKNKPRQNTKMYNHSNTDV